MERKLAPMSHAVVPRFAAADLRCFATALLERAGLPRDRAADVADVLVEGDLLGHTTHGLALLPSYLREIGDGGMPVVGEPRVVADHGSALTWDGNYLPGPWLVRRAIAVARARLAQHPLATVVIGRSHHIACLQAFLPPVTEAGLMILLTCTDPANKWVAPPGAVVPCYSPDPIAAGIPTLGDPVLLDISLSTTAAGQCVRAAKTGQRLPGAWLVDRDGAPTDDPRALVERREGGLFPLGGADLGYKGFGLALIVEALTSALAGHGRADRVTHWGSSVFLILIDPARFGGAEAFRRETSFLADACRHAAVPPGGSPVRIPGDGALARRREQLARGVALHSEILPGLAPWMAKFGVPAPSALG